MNAIVVPQGPGASSPLHGSSRGVFFHADDMGATPSMTSRMCDSWEAGLLDGFSIFGNCDHLGMIGFRLAAHPDRPVRVSVHLNLAEGRPITPLVRATGLVDRYGYFDADFVGMVRRLHFGSTRRERNALLVLVEREWRAQIENVIRAVDRRPVAALDGHIHMHMAPSLFTLAVKLAREYGIPEVRNVREPFYLSWNIKECCSKRFLANCLKREILSRLSRDNAREAETAGVRSPDRLIGVLYSGMMSQSNIAAGVAASLRQGARRIEVLVHIGRAATTELGRWNGRWRRARFVLSPSRDAEYRELMKMRSPDAAAWLPLPPAS
jgi:predicted glycoside hydrolase/deacetylase ChbG (UPF0249 family)